MSYDGGKLNFSAMDAFVLVFVFMWLQMFSLEHKFN